MNKTIKKAICMLLIAVLILTSVPADLKTDTVHAAGGTKCTQLWCSFKDNGGTTQYFYMLLPDNAGKYPVVLFFTGMGGCSGWSEIASQAASWMESGAISPFVLIMPVFDHSYASTFSGEKGSEEYFEYIQNCAYGGGTEYQEFIDGNRVTALISRLKSGEITNRLVSDKTKSVKNPTSKLDFSKDLSVAGFSMGGAASLYVGVKHRNMFPNVGAFSPSWPFYKSDDYQYDFVKKAEDVVFSSSSNAHLFMSYSLCENKGDQQLMGNVLYYKKVAESNGKNTNKFRIYDTSGFHNNSMAARCLFVFMYYVQNNKLLTDDKNKDIISAAYGDYDHPYKLESTVKATCTTDGEKHYKCKNCGKTKTEIVPALGHRVSLDKGVKATCCKKGLSAGSHCSRCGEILEAQKETGYGNHSWNSGRVTKYPTATTDGIKTFTCINCGKTKTEPIKSSGIQGTTVYNGTDYKLIYDYNYYITKYPDVKKAYGTNDKAVLRHFITVGMKELRRAKGNFDPVSYIYANKDLRKLYGNNYKSYYLQYIKKGYKENRVTKGVYEMQNFATVYDGVNYSKVYDYNYYVSKYPEVKTEFGYDDRAVLQHFVTVGIKEGRQGSESFNMQNYKTRYADLREMYGNDNASYYLHYIKTGYKRRQGN